MPLSFYEAAIQTYHLARRVEEAFYFFEKSKAIALIIFSVLLMTSVHFVIKSPHLKNEAGANLIQNPY